MAEPNFIPVDAAASATINPTISVNNVSSSSLSPAMSVNNISSPDDLRAHPPLPPGSAQELPYNYSPATAQLLARISVQRARDYDEARSHILNSIVTADRLPPLPPSQNGSRGPGRPKGSTTKYRAPLGTAVAEVPPILKRPPATRGRGRPRGSGRRGGKRKRADSEDDGGGGGISSSSGDEWIAGGDARGGAEDEDSEDGGVQLPLKTKSGRSVHRPSQFVPAVTVTSPTLTGTGRRGRKRSKRTVENAVCKACERGHSPLNNAIVFCDGCGAAYHQFCHEPPIERDVVEIPEKEWHCKECDNSGKGAIFVPKFEHFVLGDELSVEEVCLYPKQTGRLHLTLILEAETNHSFGTRSRSGAIIEH
jgi:PHD-finger